MLKKIFGPYRDEVTGEWRKFHNRDHNNIYSSLNINRQIVLNMRMSTIGTN
jgi:hypothetical protein